MGQKFSGFVLTMEEQTLTSNSSSSSSASSMSSEPNGNVDDEFVIFPSRTSADDMINGNIVMDKDDDYNVRVKSERRLGKKGRGSKRSKDTMDYPNMLLAPPSKLQKRRKQNGTNQNLVQIQRNLTGGAFKVAIATVTKKRHNWAQKLNCAGLKSTPVETYIPESTNTCSGCVCTGYRRTIDEHPAPPTTPTPIVDPSKFLTDYPIEDCDERARLERAREMAEGVEPPPGYTPPSQVPLISASTSASLTTFTTADLDHFAALFQSRLGLGGFLPSGFPEGFYPPNYKMVHTQVDYVHCLVPDLFKITYLPFYWGKMDRYEAERLLDGRPEGTFLLRDSAQEEYLFSVSFRKYERSLHARIEQWNHRFSFDSHDPGVFASPTVCGLIDHYKDSPFCMFFEPMLTIPLTRNFVFPLQHLCRAVVCNSVTYDNINSLQLPKAMKVYLKEYHYKQRVRVRWLDPDV